MQEYYKILNVSENATDEEIENSYQALKNQYSKERFCEGEKGNQAAKNLTKLENAYREIMDSRKFKDESKSNNDLYGNIEQLIRDGKLNEAQVELDAVSTRTAEWHYLQSRIFYKKNWNNEALKQLEIAINMEPSNKKYSEVYKKIKDKMESNQRVYSSGNFNSGYQNSGSQQEYSNRQMGGSSNDCMSLCLTWCCMDMMCSMCCR